LRTWADLTARAATYDLVNHLQKTVFCGASQTAKWRLCIQNVRLF